MNCPTPKKLSFSTRKRAKAFLRKNHLKGCVYKCHCGDFHTTSKSDAVRDYNTRQIQKKREALRNRPYG